MPARIAATMPSRNAASSASRATMSTYSRPLCATVPVTPACARIVYALRSP